MAELEFQLMPEDSPSTWHTPLATFHTKTLMKFLGIVRVSPNRDYKIIHSNKVVVVNYTNVKRVLDERPHVPNKAERKVIRQQKAKKWKTLSQK